MLSVCMLKSVGLYVGQMTIYYSISVVTILGNKLGVSLNLCHRWAAGLEVCLS